MPLRPDNRVITIDTSPATITLAVRMNELSPSIATGQVDKTTYVITGSHVMAGNITIAPNATGVATGIQFEFLYVADVTLGANTFQIFGYSMTAEQLLQNAKITARYDGSAWDVVLSSSFTENDIVATNHIIDLAVTTGKLNTAAVTTIKIADANVTSAKILDANVITSKIADLNVTSAKLAADSVITSKILDANVTSAKILDEAVTLAKMADITQGSIYIGDASNRPSALAIGTSTYVLQSNGTTASWVDPNSLPISNIVLTASLTIPTASVLTLNGTPIEVVPAQGANKVIQVIDAILNIQYNSATYATNTTIQLITNGATTNQMSASIAATATRITRFSASGGGVNITLLANQPLMVSVATGNPTVGDSDVKINVSYRIIDIS